MPNKTALAPGLYTQVGLIYHYAELMNKAYGAGDFAGVKAAAEQAVHLIEGAQGADAGDLDKNGTVGEGGDGFGLLTNGDQPGYLLAVKDHAALAAAQPDATEAIKQHAANVAITADNIQGWVTPIRDRALAITQAADLKATIAPISDIMSLANNAYYGVGLQADSQPQPVPGSGSAFTCYQERWQWRICRSSDGGWGLISSVSEPVRLCKHKHQQPGQNPRNRRRGAPTCAPGWG